MTRISRMLRIPPGSFVRCFLGALWVSRRIESRFVLHAALVGVVAVLIYVSLTRGSYLGNKLGYVPSVPPFFLFSQRTARTLRELASDRFPCGWAGMGWRKISAAMRSLFW
jgi:hypothetical protein